MSRRREDGFGGIGNDPAPPKPNNQKPQIRPKPSKKGNKGTQGRKRMRPIGIIGVVTLIVIASVSGFVSGKTVQDLIVSAYTYLFVDTSFNDIEYKKPEVSLQ
jgi:hypothetical protein